MNKLKGSYLGSLCSRGHDHENSGLSLRDSTNHCLACVRFVYSEKMKDPELRSKRTKLVREISRRNKDSRKKQAASFREKNREAILMKRRSKYRENIEVSRQKSAMKRAANLDACRRVCRESKQKFRKHNPDQVRKHARDYYAKNSLRIRVRNRISKALRQQKVDKVLTIDGYGISVAKILVALGPCPGDPSEWHIDHIKPLCLFDLSDREQLLLAFSPENHQWLPARENLIKSSKYA